MDLNYWSVRSSSNRRGVGIKGVDWGYILASWEYYFIRVHENLVHHPSNYISIDLFQVETWCGIMPLSPDDFPIIGKTKKYSNLFLNCGHGFRGNLLKHQLRKLKQII